MNERTHFFIKIYLSQFILERVDVGCVWEVSWRRGQTATYWPQVLLAIAALLSHLGWGCSTVGHWGPKPSIWSWFSLRWHPISNWLKPSVSWLYFCLRPPASVVLPLIYTGASLDWLLGQGSICYKTLDFYVIINLSIAVHALPMCLMTLFSFDEILLPRYMSLFFNEMKPSWLKHMNSISSEFM